MIEKCNFSLKYPISTLSRKLPNIIVRKVLTFAKVFTKGFLKLTNALHQPEMLAWYSLSQAATTCMLSSCFPGTNEKQRLSIALITRRFLLAACFCYYLLQSEVKLRHTNVLHMLFNVSCNHPWRSLILRRNALEKIYKSYNSKKSSFVLLTSLRSKR